MLEGRIDDIVGIAVAKGLVPGVVAAVAQGDGLSVVVLTQRGANESGMPAVCDEVLPAARLAA